MCAMWWRTDSWNYNFWPPLWHEHDLRMHSLIRGSTKRKYNQNLQHKMYQICVIKNYRLNAACACPCSTISENNPYAWSDCKLYLYIDNVNNSDMQITMINSEAGAQFVLPVSRVVELQQDTYICEGEYFTEFTIIFILYKTFITRGYFTVI